MNICDYLEWRGDLSFEASPFGEIDALILSQLSYYEFENLLGSASTRESMVLKELGEKHIQTIGPFEKVNLKLAIIPSVSATYLLSVAHRTDRFGNVRLTRFHSAFEPQNNVQFAAATFVTDHFAAVVFRGTDDSVAGWKEDFELSYAKTVPAQALGLAYLQEEYGRWNDRPIYVCGHSKGGNIAMYASLHMDAANLSGIKNIYNFDGPGFNQSMDSFENYALLKERIITILPESSIVGLLLHHEEDYQIISSEMISILQHNALMWQVLGNRFVYTRQFNSSSLIIKRTLQTWLEGMDDSEKEEMINILFGIVQEAGIHTLDDLNEEGVSKVIKAIRNAAMLTLDQKKKILQMVYELMRAGLLSVTGSLLESEFATEAVESAKIVKNNIADFFSDSAGRIKEAVSSGKKSLFGGFKRPEKTEES